jgi:hypothetical protein
MKFLLKKGLRATIACFFIVWSVQSQMMPMPVYSTINTPNGKVAIVTFNNVTMPKYQPGKKEIILRHPFKIVFANDSVVTEETFIDLSHKRNFMNIKWDGVTRAVIPSETKSISRVGRKGREFIGMPNDSCWLFKIHSGPITTYSVLAETDLKFTSAIQKGDGPVLPLTQANLAAMIEPGHATVHQLIRKNKLVKALKAYNASEAESKTSN